MASRSRAISVVVILLFAAVIVAILLSRSQKIENSVSKPIPQVSDPQQQTLKRLEDSLKENGMSDVSVIATEAFTIASMPKLAEGLHAIIIITSNAKSQAGYFDYVWHRSVLMREAILISHDNPAPLVLGEVRVLNREGKLTNTFYTGGISSEMQTEAQKKYFTERNLYGTADRNHLLI